MHSTGSESMSSKVGQLIMQFIVMGKDKTTKRASKAMSHIEGVATAIIVRREIWGIGHSGDRGHHGTLGQRIQCHGRTKAY